MDSEFMKYDSLEYIDNLKKKGQYPRIHNDIFKMHQFVPVKNILDIGCCYGLLSHRLSNVYEEVVGIEQNPDYAKHFICKNNIHYFNFRINKNSLNKLDKIIKKYNIKAVYCRRVIPELYDTGGMELLHYIKYIFIRNDVKYIVIEGRIKFKKAKHIFKSCYHEFSFFEDKYELIETYNNCGVLKLRNNAE